MVSILADDLSVATGRPAPHPPGPFEAHDIVTRITEKTRGMPAAKGLGRSASSDPSPYAHKNGGFKVNIFYHFFLVIFWWSMLCICLGIYITLDAQDVTAGRGGSRVPLLFKPLLRTLEDRSRVGGEGDDLAVPGMSLDPRVPG